MKTTRLLMQAVLAAALLAATPVRAGQQLQSPREFFGFTPGDKPATVEQITAYLEHLAAASPRARLEQYAVSYEGRRLFYLLISSENNLAQSEQIRADLARLADPRGLDRASADRLAATTPAVAWLAFSIHGDELSGSDAALLLAYRLCSSTDAVTEKLLRELLVFIDPMENPDGRGRTLAMSAMFSGRVANPDRASFQHTGSWPWGRWNHYWFDPNRDYLGLVHPETRGRVASWLRWTPQLVVDAHEMWGDSTFLFSPPRHPFNPHLPAHVSRWLQRFAAGAAGRFDQRGRSYYTRSWNEEFFMGYGSGWPKFFGAVGILHEQAGTEGTVYKQITGRLLPYRLTVEQQLEAALAQLETLADNRREILEDFADGRRQAVELGRRTAHRYYLFSPANDPGRTRLFIATLLAHGIEVERSQSVVTVTAHDPWSKQARPRHLPAGSYLVRADQPLAPLLHNLLDFHQPLSRKFLREERRWLERRQQSRLYETTAWSLPLLFGVAAWWSEQAPAGHWQPVTKIEAPPARLPTEKASYGYLFAGDSDNAIMLAARLLELDARLRVATEPFQIGKQKYARGAVLLRREENPRLDTLPWTKLLAQFPVQLRALAGARVADGPDLGGEEFHPLLAPRIAVLGGFPISPPDYGEIWHLLDYRLGLRFSGLELAWLPRLDLERYNVIVLPPAFGGAEACRAALGKQGRKRLAAWVRRGGTLVALGTAAACVADKDWKLVATRPRSQVLERFPPPALGLSPRQAEQAGRFRATGLVVAAAEQPAKDKQAATARSAFPEYPSPYQVEPLVGPGAEAFLPPGAPRYELPEKPVSLVDWVKQLVPGTKDRELGKLLEAADRRLRLFQPRGALLRVDTDEESWLAYGCPPRLAVHFRAPDTLVADWPVEVAARFADLDKLHLSGLLWPEGAGRIARTAYLAREQVERGQVILFADDALFRAVSWGAQRLFLNAVILGPGLGTQWAAPW